MRGDEPSPTRSSVLTRLSHGHIRIGTFQRLAFFERGREHRQAGPLLPRASVRRSAGERRRPRMRCACSTSSPARPPALAASYHGRRLRPRRAQQRQYQHHRRELRLWPVALHARMGPRLHRRLFRPTGLYAFGRQPEAIHWDLAQLAGCLALVAEAPPLSDMLAGWGDRFEDGAGRSAACAARRRRRAAPTRTARSPRR